MLKKTPYEYFQDAIELANKEDLPSASRIIYVTFLLLQVAARIAVNLARDGDATDKLAVKDALLRIYREHVVPYDIPGLPAFIESYIDNAGEAAVATGLDIALSRLSVMHEHIDKILAD